MATAVCEVCSNLESDFCLEIQAKNLIAAADQCKMCSAIFKALQSVTDVTRPEFTKLEIERGGNYLDQGVLQVRCIQTGEHQPGKIHQTFKDPFPNRYSIYAPAGIGEELSLPGLGVRSAESSYREHLTSIEERIELAKSWLEDCVENHANCQNTTTSRPRRLLHLSHGGIRLVETSKMDDVQKYAALSYCWGADGNITTRKESLQAHLAGLDLATLPATHQEAIHLCLKLGLEYLWIDALCIIQDDTDDWRSQIPQMASIYSGAQLVIAAQAASSVKDGCFSFGPSSNAPFKRLELDQVFESGPRTVKLSIQEENMQYHTVPGHHSARPHDDEDALSTRAWAFQEKFLANRVLYCTRSELSWKCAECQRCECQVNPVKTAANIFTDYWGLSQLSEMTKSADLDESNPMKLLSLWCEVVRQYSSRKLSKSADRLAAVEGIVTSLTENFPDFYSRSDYVVGMWRPFLERLLTWRTLPLSKDEARMEWDSPESQTLQESLPSWSWARVMAPVEYYPFAWEHDASVLVKVQELGFEPNDDVLLGGGRATMLLSGLLIPTTVSFDEMPDIMPEPLFSLPKAFKSREKYALEPSLEIILDDVTEPDSWVWVTHYVPLLQEAGEYPKTQGIFVACVDEDEGIYRRVGYTYDYSSTICFENGDNIERYMTSFCLI